MTTEEQQDEKEFKEWYVKQGYYFGAFHILVESRMKESWLASRRTLRERLREEQDG